ncbi:MAG: hypothetical protein LUE89_01730 [Clostridiales bacterium]|nr:hypothetical protein [Clostridiales bacterium]
MRKYSFWLTSLLGVIALSVLVIGWNQIDMLHKLPIMYIVALALHETEELKLPGGFIEMVTDMTGLQLKNLGMAKFGLLMFTLYATVLPAFLAGWVWPVMSTLFIGILVSEDDGSAMQSELNVAKWIEEGGVVATGSFDGISDQDTRESVISEFLAQDANIYFLKINSGTGSMDGDGNALNGSHRMTFRIAYDLPCVKEWLFEQVKTTD